MNRKEIEKEAKTPDAFLTWSERLLKWAENNLRVVGVAVAALLVIGLGWVGVTQWQTWTEHRAAEAIYKAQSKLEKKREELSKAEAEALKEKKVQPSKNPTAEFEANLAEPARELEVAIVAHNHTRAAAVAAIDLAGIYLSYKKADLASALLSQIDGGGSEILRTLIQVQSATAAFEQGDYTRASSQFEQLVQDPGSEYVHADVLLRLGLCYEKLNQLDKAKETYSRVATEFSDSESGKTAKGYLRLLELESQNKPAQSGEKKAEG